MLQLIPITLLRAKGLETLLNTFWQVILVGIIVLYCSDTWSLRKVQKIVRRCHEIITPSYVIKVQESNCTPTGGVYSRSGALEMGRSSISPRCVEQSQLYIASPKAEYQCARRENQRWMSLKLMFAFHSMVGRGYDGSMKILATRKYVSDL
jgi:hypothetical protein